jgi:hypothetical protein
MDPRINCLTHVVECPCRAIIDRGPPLSVEAAGGQEPLVFEVDGEPGDKGLILGGPCRQGTEPDGHQPFAVVLAGEQPRQDAVTRVGLAAHGSAMAGGGVPHD